MLILGLVGAVFMALALVARHRQSPAANIAVNLLGYTNRSGSLVAEMQVTNKGLGSVVYGAYGSIPYGWVKAQTITGWTNGRMAPPFTGSIVVVPPKASVAFSFPLPEGTLHWRCGFGIQTANVRERTAYRLFKSGVSSRADRIPICGRLLGLMLNLLPSKTTSELDFQSDLFDVEAPKQKQAEPAAVRSDCSFGAKADGAGRSAIAVHVARRWLCSGVRPLITP
jgi:hypothetical protein